MSDLLEAVIETHAGIQRWNQLNFVAARLIKVRARWSFNGQAGVLGTVRKAAHP